MAEIVSGLDGVLRELRKVPEGARGRKLDDAVRLAAQLIVEQAQIYAPVGETGRLRNSINTQKASRLSGPNVSRYSVGYRKGYSRKDWNGAYYGGFVELGTRYQTPQPYLRPAMFDAGDAAIDAMAKRLQRNLGLR